MMTQPNADSREVYIRIEAPTDEAWWGDECDEVIARYAANERIDRLGRWARERWPKANLSLRLVGQLTGSGISAVTADGEHVEEIEEALEREAELRWIDCLDYAWAVARGDAEEIIQEVDATEDILEDIWERDRDEVIEEVIERAEALYPGEVSRLALEMEANEWYEWMTR